MMSDYGYEWCGVCDRETLWRYGLPDSDERECTEHEDD